MTSIRPPVPADLPALAVLLGDLGYPTDPGTADERLAEVTAAGGVVLVAEIEGEVLGVAVVHRMVPLHRPPVAYLSALVVRPAARGTGVGRALVDAAETQGQAWGCRTLELTSNDARTDAHRFYTHLGFAGTSRKFRRPISGR